MPGKKRKLQDLTTDEFFATGLDSDSDIDEAPKKPSKQPKVKLSSKKDTKKSATKRESAHDHKKSLDKLKEKDPEFYEFLKNEEKNLLAFDPSDISDEEAGCGGEDEEGSKAESGGEVQEGDEEVDDEIEDEEDDEDEEDEEEEGDGSESESSSAADEEDDSDKFHKPPQKLEVASDSEDDMEVETAESKKDSRIKVTMKMIDEWTAKMKTRAALPAINAAVTAFKAAVHQNDENKSVTYKYRVVGGGVFNAIVRMCILDLYPAFLRELKISKLNEGKKSANIAQNPNWHKIKDPMKSYLSELLYLASYMHEPAILNVILKHVYQLIPFFCHFPKLIKGLIKTLVNIWSSGEETSRVLAFLSVNSITRKLQDTFLEYVLKQMYMAYVKNCKFTSPTTLPLISFMQRSLVEMFAIDAAVTYQYAFVYIRQLAIHLRNAITIKTKETRQAVYNWQYIHSLHLWSRLVCQLWPNPTLEPLVYPLVQIIQGVVKLMPSPYYYPLRFHCVKALNMICEETGIFIPVLPLITEILELTDFEKRPKRSSVKPYNFACTLKFSKTETSDKAFLDGVMDNVYDHLIESYAIQAHCVGFPELVLPSTILIKAFVKKENLPNNYRKMIRQVLEKVQQTTQVITTRRKRTTLSLADTVAMESWERRSKEEGTPLSKYYVTYKPKRDHELQKEIMQKDQQLLASEDLPVIERRVLKGPAKASEQDRQEFQGLFASDDDDEEDSEEDDEERFKLKEERKKKLTPKEKSKKHVDEEEDYSDQYSDLNDEELAALDRSASEDEEGDDDEEDDEEEEGESEGEREERDVNDDEDPDNSPDDEPVGINKKKAMAAKKDMKQTTTTKDTRNTKGVEAAKKTKKVPDDSDASDEGDIVEDFVFSDEDSE